MTADFPDDLDAPEMPLAFDESGRPIAVEHPRYEEPPPPDWLREQRLEAITRLLEVLCTKNTTALAAGQQLFALGWICNAVDFSSQREMAEFLGVSDTRATQIMADLARDWPALSRLKKRQRPRTTKTHPHS